MSKLSKYTSNKVAFNLINFNGGQPKKSVQFGPTKIFDPSFIGRVNRLNSLQINKDSIKNTFDYNRIIAKDHAINTFIKNSHECSFANLNIFKTNTKYMREGHFVVNIGGDHSIAIGTLLATLESYKDCIVVWVDAHPDINKVSETLSGNVHGCPLSFAAKLNSKVDIPEFEWTYNIPSLNLKNLIYIGIRDIDEAEKRTIEKYSIKSYYIDDIKTLGIDKITQQIQAEICKKQLPVHLSIDVDSMDPEFIKSTGTPVPNGLLPQHCYTICQSLLKTNSLVNLDLVEVHPGIGNETDCSQTIKISQDIICSALCLEQESYEEAFNVKLDTKNEA